ncbi:hypothetical protein RUM43_006844 [Polyplax serrata]|uniref:Uncharacterized protein n=1 Tax=Polyplax serrata TaxID=468196 RepID=A0AAN8PL60_POLSC
MPAKTPAGAPENGGPPRTELQELQLKAGQVTDESLESTRRMLALCEECDRIRLMNQEHVTAEGKPFSD